ncbi:uncharacterized protein LOC119554828 [Drosophila subpulchrella]|uniref:uncharacterized protein LOC119554828 n=1 Tax=Drosophila subpulchrella TaxID=1486046 RepID=UPI0018A19E72|nr:uncharacterized protein LOC119554828 [Drosophila subpulchrella]
MPQQPRRSERFRRIQAPGGLRTLFFLYTRPRESLRRRGGPSVSGLQLHIVSSALTLAPPRMIPLSNRNSLFRLVLVPRPSFGIARIVPRYVRYVDLNPPGSTRTARRPTIANGRLVMAMIVDPKLHLLMQRNPLRGLSLILRVAHYFAT